MTEGRCAPVEHDVSDGDVSILAQKTKAAPVKERPLDAYLVLLSSAIPTQVQQLPAGFQSRQSPEYGK